MANIGQLKWNGKGFTGKVRTLRVSLRLSLSAVKQKRGDDGPDFDAFAVTDDGEIVPVGSVWKRTIQRGDREGQTMLSLSLDDPSFTEPLNLAAFNSEEADTLDVVWNRPRQKEAA